MLLLILVSTFGCSKKQEWGVDAFVDGRELMDMCGTESPQHRTACFHYILGVVDSRAATYSDEKGKDWLCGAPTRKDLASAVLGYLRAHPDASARAAGPLVHSAVDRAFGCDYKSEE